MKKFVAAAALAAMVATTPNPAMAMQDDEKEKGSLYLRCDGEPNNMTGGESFARLLGAVTLLGLFAPAPESPDPSKRLFAEEGVDACTQLIDGEKAEGNAVRRIPLILARGLHQIEAKNYEAALADVERARAEAKEAGLAGNPYFDRSMGLSFSNIEAEALLRMGDASAAREAALAPIDSMKYSFVPSGITSDYGDFNPTFSPAAERKYAANAKVLPSYLASYASRLDQVGRFEDSAEKLEAFIDVIEGLEPENIGSYTYARAALTYAMAGNWDRADELALFARDNLAGRRAAGKPEDSAAKSIELLDLYDIVKLANEGDMKTARRNFAARSEWVEPSFGVVSEVNRRLREGATEEELFGSLTKTPDEMWQERYDERMAVKLQKDTDNKTLFGLIQPYAKVNDFEDRSKNTWRVEKSSKMMSKEPNDVGQYRIWASGSIYSGIDSIMLHAALQAKQRGKEGFTMIVLLPTRTGGYYLPTTIGLTRFVDSSETEVNPISFIPADEVIAELSQVIPSPDEVKRRKKERRRK